MKKYTIALTALLFMLAGCGSKTETVRLFYSNGADVTDSIHANALMLEAGKIIRERHLMADELHVYSTLRPGINNVLHERLKPIEDEICRNINWKNTRKSGLRKKIDKLRKDEKFFDAGVVAIDNRTGQIVTWFSTSGDQTSDGVSAPAPIGSLHQTFSFLQGLQREYTPFDSYPRFDYWYGSNRPDPDFKRPFYVALEMSSPTYAQGLDRRYTKQQSEEFLQQLEIRHGDLTDTIFRFKTTMSLLDVTKTYSAFYNKGLLHRPFMIDSITDGNGRLLYKRKIDTKRVLDEETANEIMQILAFHYAHEPRDELYSERNVPEFIGQFKALEARFNGNGWFIAITGDYTIGVRNFNTEKGISYPKKSRHMQLRDRTFPLWYRTLGILREDGRAVPSIRTFDLSRMN